MAYGGTTVKRFTERHHDPVTDWYNSIFLACSLKPICICKQLLLLSTSRLHTNFSKERHGIGFHLYTKLDIIMLTVEMIKEWLSTIS